MTSRSVKKSMMSLSFTNVYSGARCALTSGKFACVIAELFRHSNKNRAIDQRVLAEFLLARRGLSLARFVIEGCSSAIAQSADFGSERNGHCRDDRFVFHSERQQQV